MLYKNRSDAGKKLAESLDSLRETDAVVLGLARGGMVIAFEVVKYLKLPLDVIMTRKIGAPQSPEFALGAITETGKGYFDQAIIDELSVSNEYIEKAIKQEQGLANERLEMYRKARRPLDLRGKTVILCDDGIATGSTMMAAVISVKESGAKKIIIAVPVASTEAVAFLSKECDQFICLHTPSSFMGISQFYEEFDQVKDEEIITILKQSDVKL